MKSSELRKRFIQFFESKKHTFAPGSSIVPEDDPSLLFINAGMNQFKDVFLGSGERPYTRAVNSQICVRVSGKHNDLEDVGKDDTHLTSFEMLGNWSFGDYYKKEAIEWAWELLTEELKIPKYRLVATVFEEDDEAYDLWQKNTDVSQVVRCDAVDNFWEMGKTGPCGPCSEIHVYLKDDPIPPGLSQDDLNDGEYIELWNLVFIQYNRLEDSSLESLPNKHVDTGAGFERLLAFMQGTSSNYETDLFNPIIKKIEQLAKKPYEKGEEGMPFRVMADHVRTLCFGIANNCYPSNEGRGYVLRRLLRRSCRYAKKLGFDKPVLYKLVPEVIESLGDFFEHLKSKEAVIEKVILSEEESFLQTLSSGLSRFDDLRAELKANNQSELSGEDAFKLYDTYGFPIDLSALLAEEAGLSVDLKEFERLLNEQRERSRQASQFQDMSGDSNEALVEAAQFEGLDLHLADDLNVAKGGEARIIHDRDEKVGMARHHTGTHLLHEVLRRTLGDHVHQAGSLVDSNRLRFDFSHFESIPKDRLKNIEADVNEWIKNDLPVSISKTTLEDAKAKGAMALFGEKYDPSEVRVVDIGAESIELCAGTHVTHTGLIEDLKIISESAISAGTRRIEAIAGDALINDYLSSNFESKRDELTKQLNHLITDWQSLDATKAKELSKQLDKLNSFEKSKSNTDLEAVLNHCDKIADIVTVYKKDLKKAKQKNTTSYTKESLSHLLEQECQIGDSAMIVTQVDNQSINELRDMSDHLVSFKNKLIVVLSSHNDGKASLVIKYAKDVDANKLSASDLIKKITEVTGGGGGGRPNMAQAGGLDASKLEDGLNLAKTLLTESYT